MSHWGERGVWVDQDVMEEQKRENIHVRLFQLKRCALKVEASLPPT